MNRLYIGATRNWDLSGEARVMTALTEDGPRLVALVAPDAELIRMLSAAPDLLDVAQRLVTALTPVGFGTDEDINGADAVEIIGTIWPDLCAAVARAEGRMS